MAPEHTAMTMTDALLRIQGYTRSGNIYTAVFLALG